MLYDSNGSIEKLIYSLECLEMYKPLLHLPALEKCHGDMTYSDMFHYIFVTQMLYALPNLKVKYVIGV